MAEREGLFALRAHPCGASVASAPLFCAALLLVEPAYDGHEGSNPCLMGTTAASHKSAMGNEYGGEGGIIRAARSPLLGQRR